MRGCKSFLDTITRRKPWDVRSLYQTEFTRSLNVVDLVGIGVGSTAGLGVFVIVAHVTRAEAGPAAVLSVLIASILALLSGLCHTELSTRLPRCGTGYTFCYISLGELLSFVIGWSTILENVLAGAMATKAVWQYVEYMVNATNTSNITRDMDMTSEPIIMMEQPDLFPCCIAVAVVFLGFITLKRSAVINLVLICMSGMVVFAFICVGFLHVQAGNWNAQPGFFAKGLSGIMTGASLMMIVFSGIDNLLSCAEETKSPSQTVPTAFSFSLPILSTISFLVTAALTLSTPWQQLADQAALARAYEDRGIYAANYVIGVGAVLGLVPCIVGSFIHPVRVLFAMSEDHLMPQIFSKRAYNGIPIGPHFLTGALITLCALLLDFYAALEMASIATIIQFLASAIILLFIRYQPQPIGICREYSDLDNVSMDYSERADMMSRRKSTEKQRPQLMIFANGDCKIHHEKESSFPAMKKSMSSDSALTKHYSSLYCETSITPTPVINHNHKPALMSSFVPTQTGPLTFSNRFKYSKKDHENNHMVLYDEPSNQRQSNRTSRNKFKSTSVKLEDYETMQLNTDFARSFGSLKSLASSAGSSIVALSSCDIKHADEQTWKHTRFFLLTYVTSSTCMTAMLWVWPLEADRAWWAITLFIISIILMIISSVCIARRPQNNTPLYFKAPYAPLVPLLAITGNMAMLAALPFLSWLRFSVWLLCGLIIYIFYSHRHSLHQPQDEQEEVLFDISELNTDDLQDT